MFQYSKLWKSTKEKFVKKMQVFRQIFPLAFISFVVSNKSLGKELESNKMDGLNAVEIIKARGYPVEEYDVITEDGYILALYRIPRGKDNSHHIVFRPPLLIMHGLGASSADFVNVENGLAFVLADYGYDVWIGNARGTNWSQNHTNVQILQNQKKFWDFSWHEIGYYDIPATIDFILNVTNQKKLFYVGHSQGGTVYFVAMSLRPEYNEKITLAILLAPGVFFKHHPSKLLKGLSKNANMIKLLTEALGLHSVPVKFIRSLTKTFCKLNSIYRPLCLNLVYISSGWPDPRQLDGVDLAVLATNSPSPCSVKQVIHYLQLFKSDKFSLYDYGPSENMKRYSSKDAPEYNLSKVTSDVAIFYAKNDNAVSVKDIRFLLSLLPNVVVDHLIEYEQFNHIDFLSANDAIFLLYNDIINLLFTYL